MSDELSRISVTIPKTLLEELDDYVACRGMSVNRSEAVRDLVRNALVKEQGSDPEGLVFGALTMVYDHHAHDLRDKLDSIQHSHTEAIVASVHVHASEHYCLETIIMRGKSQLIRELANSLLGTKGVLNGDLVVTTIPEEHEHAHEHDHGYAHDHDAQ